MTDRDNVHPERRPALPAKRGVCESIYEWCNYSGLCLMPFCWEIVQHARKRPQWPANAEIRPGCGFALPGPLRRRTDRSVRLKVRMALQEWVGVAGYIRQEPAAPGYRCRSAAEPYAASSGTFMPLKRHTETICVLISDFRERNVSVL